jgi:hypothetical protein
MNMASQPPPRTTVDTMGVYAAEKLIAGISAAAITADLQKRWNWVNNDTAGAIVSAAQQWIVTGGELTAQLKSTIESGEPLPPLVFSGAVQLNVKVTVYNQAGAPSIKTYLVNVPGGSTSEQILQLIGTAEESAMNKYGAEFTEFEVSYARSRIAI